MKKYIDNLDAVPKKRLFLSIIADYDLNRSVCELIDNALDNWFTNNQTKTLNVELIIDTSQQTILIKDNSGGIIESDLSFVISPGETGNDPNSDIIGIFGVGTKRAIIALAKDVKIKSRFKNNNTYLVEFDDSWQEDNDWTLPYYMIDEIDEDSTIIYLQSLRFEITQEMVDLLNEHLSATYAKFLLEDKFEIIVNNESIVPKVFENWAYPPNYEPKILKAELKVDSGDKVNVEIIGGLTTEASPATGEYGVYFYCNKRLVARALKTLEVGFSTGLAGKPHPKISTVRVIVNLEGSAKLMPWNSSKSGIYFNHKIYKIIQDYIIQILKHYATVSRNLVGKWPEEIFKFTTGQMTEEEIDFIQGTRLHLPPTPLSKPQYQKYIKQVNMHLLNNKPWTKGLVGGIIAADIIFKKKFDEKNRIALIVLDSTIEIAFKEFLVRESGKHYSDAKLLNIFQSRHLVEKEVKKYVRISDTDWGKIRYYYDKRCKLIHQTADVDIKNSDIEDYRLIVENTLQKLFDLNFSYDF